MITVIIPYFQRSPGVLRKALASIAAQQNCPLPVHVIVVDDASPIPPKAEVDSVSFAPGTSIQIIAQENGGPGAARNTGLDAAPPATQFIAFLDSDDEWAAQHLSRAIQSLGCQRDLFFGDHFQLGQSTGAFERGRRIQIESHSKLPLGAAGLHNFDGDIFDQTIRGNLIGTSTVVYDFKHFPALRFRVDLTNAGEDYLFWMELAKAGARCAFSSMIEATYGRGVNIYASSGWGTEQFALRTHNELKFRKKVMQLFDLNAEQRQLIAVGIKNLRQAFAADVLHRISHRKQIAKSVMLAQWSLDPQSFLILPWVFAKKVLGKS